MRTVTQLPVTISSEAGSVSDAISLLGEAGVDIRGFSVHDSAGRSVLRLIVDQPERARKAFVDAGLDVATSEVLVIALPDRPGGLAGVLKEVTDAGVAIEYVYSLVSTFAVLNVASPGLAIELLAGRPVEVVTLEEIVAS
jgi:hypothetical protein